MGEFYTIGGGGTLRDGMPDGPLPFEHPEDRYKQTYMLSETGGPADYTTYITQ